MISLAEHDPNLVKEWDYELNSKLGLTPENVSYGSARKVWWKCEKGHSYLMGLNSRTCAGKKRQSCSVCAGTQVIEGYNDLESKYPNLVEEWNYELNDKLNLNPKNVSYGSSKKVWWTCSKGHIWNAPISRRTGKQSSGCPFCSNQKLLKSYNDLETQFPEIAKEFNTLKNRRLPSEYLYGSSTKVWWICSKCGYEWKTSIHHRTGEKNTGCPNCGHYKARETQLKNQMNSQGSLYDNFPDLMEEWIYEKNDRKPNEIVPGSEYKAWWKCKKCNWEWQSIVASRTTNGTGCPVCGSRVVVEGINDFKSQYPELVKEWDYKKNDEIGLRPNEVTPFSDKKAWWICPICNESYETCVKHRTRGTTCPHCANEYKTSFPEQTIYYYLKQEFKDTQNRYDLIGKEADIFVPSMNLAIEYDGSYYHNNKASLEREKIKYEHFKENNIKLIRIREKNIEYDSYSDFVIQLKKNNNDNELENMVKEIFDVIGKLFNYEVSIEIDLKKDRQYIYKQYIKQIKENSLAELYPELLNEWDYNKNIIKPEQLVPGSERKVWWICNKGHSYEQQLAIHVKGARCPYCCGLLVIPGENDLETKFPEIAKEWDYEKNEKKTSEIKYGSSKKAWWICPKGHSFEATISHRTGPKKEKCPVCNGKKVLIGYNDLKSQRPELIEEWDYSKNIKGPEEYTCGSQKKVWWKCPKGHSYDAIIRSRANNKTKCPICNGKRVLEGFNDFLSQQPELMEEWNYETNNDLGIYPNKIYYHAWKNVWWKCKTCNHEWKAMPGSRSEGRGCPKCSLFKIGKSRMKNTIKREGSLKDNYPELIKEWNYEKNEYGPEEYTSNTHKKVWWRCSKCNHEWLTEIRVRTKQKSSCPKCKNK